jgi:hypothetical protein
MEYIYCAIFSDGTAKFGRSVDVWKRLYSLDAEGKRFGRILRSCLLSTVFDGVRDERNILECAAEMLDPVSRESFKAENPQHAAEVFNAARVPYLFCEMSNGAFGPVLTQNSFSPDFSKTTSEGGHIGKPTRKDRVKARILKVIDTYNGPVTRSIFKNRLLNYSDDYVGEVIEEMKADGVIRALEYEKSQCGYKYERV